MKKELTEDQKVIMRNVADSEFFTKYMGYERIVAVFGITAKRLRAIRRYEE